MKVVIYAYSNVFFQPLQDGINRDTSIPDEKYRQL